MGKLVENLKLNKTRICMTDKGKLSLKNLNTLPSHNCIGNLCRRRAVGYEIAKSNGL